MRKIILASASPRRREFLEKIGLKFEVVPSNFDEKINTNLTPAEVVKELSLCKTKDVARKNKGAIIISADTIVVSEKKILGKPKDKNDAKRMLKILSGNCHSVITGFTIMDTLTKKTITDFEETKVYFRKIKEDELAEYLNTDEPYDKAGGYAIQGRASIFVEKIEGDFSNVVGLPLNKLIKELKNFGIEIKNRE